MGRFCFQVLALITVLLILGNSCVCLCKNSTSICIKQEREVLLQFKQNLLDPIHFLSSWKGEDCCKWKGVTCDRVYGHVIELQFLPQTIRGENGTLVIPMEEKLSTIGKLNSSLLKLRFLNYLDLSGINFKHGGIPIFLGSMKQLRYLNLSFGNFYGTVPRQLGNLTELEVLDLHDDHGDLFVDDTHWVSYLRSLNYLDMSGLNFTGHGDLMQVINMLPSLSHLSLSACGLRNFHLSSIRLANSTSLVHLQYLDLSTNFLEGPITNDVFQNMTSLQHLDLSQNSFNSSIPMWFGKLTSLVLLNLEGNFFLSIEGGLFSFLKSKKYLKSLNLCGNQIREETLTSHGNSSRFIENNLESLVMCNNYLSDALPNWLVSFTLLRYLDLHSNFFSGPILGVIGELPNLVTIDLSHNQLNGTIPSSLGQLSSLRSLNLSYNRLFGHIPESLGQLRALQDLRLDNNHLNGTVPSNLGELSHLLALYLSDNALGGVISEIHFANLSRLKYLDIGNNYNLTFKATPGWRPPFQLRSIRMNSCKFITTFPHWMQTQVEVSDLYLSNASIFGALPKWLGNVTFSHFDLSYNQITGTLPNVFFNCSILDLSHNLISRPLPANIGEMCIKTLYLNDNLINGPIPSSLCDMLDLIDLDLSNNKLSGSIPDCWKGSRLSHLILSFNKLSGVIPSSIGSLSDLYILRLNGNHFNGELPLALGYCTSLVILDLGENNFSGSIPTWFNDSFWILLILRLRENSFSGSIPPQLCALPGLQILDMATNNLTGVIPHCLGYMNGMKTFNQDNLARFLARFEDLNKEHVVEIMKGRYNEYTKIVLDLVVNLDLSSNNLIGSIPEELTFLAGLHGLNLSHNLLSGGIPIGIGDMKSLESLDHSNNLLLGTIPPSISMLTFLEYLNLSNNNFTGQIPKGNQIQTLDDPSIYAGNPLLCGNLLKRKCPSAEAPQASKISHEEDKLEKALFYVVVMLGFATGFWGFFGVLQFKKDWRHAYFSFVDRAIDEAYVAIAVKVAKLKGLRQSRSA